MTTVEKEIYAVLKREKSDFTLELLAELYVRAHNSSTRIYNKIDWAALNAEIKRVRGQGALNYVRRKAVKQQ